MTFCLDLSTHFPVALIMKNYFAKCNRLSIQEMNKAEINRMRLKQEVFKWVGHFKLKRFGQSQISWHCYCKLCIQSFIVHCFF